MTKWPSSVSIAHEIPATFDPVGSCHEEIIWKISIDGTVGKGYDTVG